MSFVCCFCVLGFSENRQFAPRTIVRAANLLAETWGKTGSAQFPPRTIVRAANCLAETWGLFDSLSSRRELLFEPRTLFTALFPNFKGQKFLSLTSFLSAVG